jgi:hypothetical protein
MITIKDFMEAVEYRITEGSEYCWNSFGPNAYRLESWNGEQDGHTVSILFDTKTQTVYQMEAHDYKAERSYRWTHPDYLTAYRDECKQHSNNDMAYDDVKFTELDVHEDMLKKANAIVRGEEYDTRVTVPVDLNDDELFTLMKLAHERDVTLNKLIEDILQKVIDRDLGR